MLLENQKVYIPPIISNIINEDNVKALRCLNCKTYVVVMDSCCAYCMKCQMELHEDKYLNRELKLKEDDPVKRKYIIRNKKKKVKKRKTTKNKKKPIKKVNLKKG